MRIIFVSALVLFVCPFRARYFITISLFLRDDS